MIFVLAIFLIGLASAYTTTTKFQLDINKMINKSIQEINKTKVCCKIYGFGSNMEKVNVNYNFVEKDDCSVPEDFVGGGREVVGEIYCKKQLEKMVMERNRLRIQDQTLCPVECLCSGSTMKCTLEGGREMTVTAGKSGNIIVQIKGVNMTTNTPLYKLNRVVYGIFKDNRTKALNVLPDEVKERIRERIKAKLENQTDIELDEDGIYQVQVRKRARLFFLIPVKEKVKMQIDPETGEFIKIRNPWWGFLAKDIEEEETEE